jgi:uncharacterized membrane protein required for colicin V production
MVAGSYLWQTIFLVVAALLLALEILRGWRSGLVRQLVRLLALAAAYAAAFFGGRLVLPVVRHFVKAPDLVLSIIAGAILAAVVYAIIIGTGRVLFKRTGQQNSTVVKLLYGGSGALLGIFFGLFTIWLMVVAIRSLGSVASAEVRTETAEKQRARSSVHAAPNTTATPLVTSIAKLKNSIELGSVGDAVKTVDVVPAEVYYTLGKVGQIASNAESARRFLAYPGAKTLAENPRIVALRNDPEIARMIRQQHVLDLMQNRRVIDALNDPALAAQVRSFEFQRALDYAMKRD